jgi:hypothetical protein
MYRGIKILADHPKHDDSCHPQDEQNKVDRIAGSRRQQSIELRIRGEMDPNADKGDGARDGYPHCPHAVHLVTRSALPGHHTPTAARPPCIS